MEKEYTKENINEALKQEILAMVEADQKMRKSHEWNSEIDRKNTARMKEIIKLYGWPGKSLIGMDGATGAWLLVQHADHNVEFQKQALELLKEAVEKEEAEKKALAYLTDRVRVNSGESQVFGTQFYTNEKGEFGPRPIENPETLDRRRKEFGLNSFFDYEKHMRGKYKEFREKEQSKKEK